MSASVGLFSPGKRDSYRSVFSLSRILMATNRRIDFVVGSPDPRHASLPDACDKVISLGQINFLVLLRLITEEILEHAHWLVPLTTNSLAHHRLLLSTV